MFALNIVTAAVVVVHVLASLGMIVLILLHSGRGGGVSDMFGGGASSVAAGSTVVEKNLDRLTVAAGVTWIFATIVLGLRL